jgi:hypothetical protein
MQKKKQKKKSYFHKSMFSVSDVKTVMKQEKYYRSISCAAWGKTKKETLKSRKDWTF